LVTVQEHHRTDDLSVGTFSTGDQVREADVGEVFGERSRGALPQVKDDVLALLELTDFVVGQVNLVSQGDAVGLEPSGLHQAKNFGFADAVVEQNGFDFPVVAQPFKRSVAGGAGLLCFSQGLHGADQDLLSGAFGMDFADVSDDDHELMLGCSWLWGLVVPSTIDRTQAHLGPKTLTIGASMPCLSAPSFATSEHLEPFLRGLWVNPIADELEQ
jgi:hypothetical protein